MYINGQLLHFLQVVKCHNMKMMMNQTIIYFTISICFSYESWLLGIGGQDACYYQQSDMNFFYSPPSTTYHCLKSDWTNEDLFMFWLNILLQDQVWKILSFWAWQPRQPLDREAYTVCKWKGIVVICIPPPISHRL